MPKITYFQRKRRANANHSIEQIFNALAVRFSKKYDIQQYIVPFVSLGFFKRFINMLAAPLNQGDVNHVTGDINYVAILLKKEKTISTILDLGILHRTTGIRRKILLEIWFRLPVKRSKWVTVISQATKDDLIKNVSCSPDKVKVIYVPISKDFKPNNKTFNTKKPTILQIGGAPNKNLTGLINAVQDISCKLLIVGKIAPENGQLLKNYKIEYENLVGISQEEVVQCYENCDLLFFASTFEGFGMPILEAQAVGRPVITSNILSMPEVGGDAALYVNPHNNEEIKDKILELMTNSELRQSLIEKGFENVKRFDEDTIAQQYESLYELVLKQHL